MKNLVFGPIWPSENRINGFLDLPDLAKPDLPDLAKHFCGLPQYQPPIPNMPF